MSASTRYSMMTRGYQPPGGSSRVGGVVHSPDNVPVANTVAASVNVNPGFFDGGSAVLRHLTAATTSRTAASTASILQEEQRNLNGFGETISTINTGSIWCVVAVSGGLFLFLLLLRKTTSY